MQKRVARKTTVIKHVFNCSYASCLYYFLSDARESGFINSETFRSTRGMLVKQPESVENLLSNVGYLG